MALIRNVATPSRPHAHHIGDVGQAAVALLFKRWGWTADPVSSDYGEDLDCTVFLERRRTALHFRCQIKARGSGPGGKVRRLKSGGFAVQVASSTANAWALSYFPVLLCVYDAATDRVGWVDASRAARDLLGSGSRSTVTFRVPGNDLEAEQAGLLTQIQDHYARLFRLDSAELRCEVFPVFMPSRRAVPGADRIEISVQQASNVGLSRSSAQLHLDDAPAWVTAIDTLEGPHLAGWQLSAPNGNVDAFIESVQRLLEVSPRLANGEWLAFIRSPVRLCSPGQSHYPVSFGVGDLTGWSCYSKFDDRVVDDYAHAFRAPGEFLGCIARRGVSWPGDWFVDEGRDIAVQFFAAVPTTPAYRRDASTRHRHNQGQFLVWECEPEDVGAVRAAVRSVDLVFREVEGVSSCDGSIVGIVATPFFQPEIGLSTRAKTWAEYDGGSVRTKLESVGMLSRLCGREGSPELRSQVMGVFGDMFEATPDELLTSGDMTTPGVPLDHSRRMICVQRFRSSFSGDMRALEAAVEKLRQCLPPWLNELPEAELSCDSFSGVLGPIVALNLCWAPPLLESAKDALAENLEAIADLFDGLMPRLSDTLLFAGETKDVLRFDGALYFEGDMPWGSRVAPPSDSVAHA